MPLTSKEVKDAARGFGADVVGIGSVNRWNSAPAERDPRMIMPRAKSVICVGFRVHRGDWRGVEEGTYYAGYTLTGFADINNHAAPMLQRRLASFIEDRGFETAAVLHDGAWLGQESGRAAKRPNGADKPKPDVFLNVRISAALCGVGEIGLSRVVLTPEFGPAQRLYLLVTEAELEPDPIITGICDGCGECIRRCPARALAREKSDDVIVPGVAEIRRAGLDVTKCSLAHCGALSPFAPEDVREYTLDIIGGTETHTASGAPRPTREEIAANVTDKIPYARNMREYFQSPPGLCAGEGCQRACLAHLEACGKLTRRFAHPFREK
ncbi:MAG: (4Fe-4S)-binding protein [Oscillospiraceae bacterium]|nr:(4Fe-4S)-binding protein [Oscillospiraceae bacterium]